MKLSVRHILAPIIFLCVYVIFHQALEALISNSIVTPFLSNADFDQKPASAFALFALIALTVGWMVKKMVTGFRFSSAWVAWSIIIWGLFVYYRHFASVWNFAELWDGFSALDVLYFLPLPFVFTAIWAERTQQKNTLAAQRKFLRDDPIHIKKESDHHERHAFMTEIKDLIINTQSGESSFCIGVAGAWGTGKSTFLRTLRQEFSDDNNQVLQIDFNPWTQAANGSLIEAFLTEFSYELGKNTDRLEGELEKYARILAGGNSTTLVARVIQFIFPSFRWEQSSAEASKRSISRELEKLQKKVIVYIDDIDRLDRDEVCEVFKLVRNSAGFSNVVYVIAFDKTQVENALSDQFKSNSNTYLDKIFQVEFHLPPLNSDLIFGNLLDGIEEQLTAEDRDFFSSIREDIGLFGLHISWMQAFFVHQRDVVRFLNQFNVHYGVAKSEVFLPDFIAIMILRYKYPVFNTYFFSHSLNYLSSSTNDSGREEYFLRASTNSLKASETTLYEALKNGIQEAQLPEFEYGPIDILKFVFENRGNGNHTSDRTLRIGPKYLMSARYPEYFSRYFDFNFQGRLSDVAFNNALEEPLEEFENKIINWSRETNTRKDLLTTLERLNYRTKQQFERIVYITLCIARFNESKIVSRKITGRFHSLIFLSESNARRLHRIYPNAEDLSNFLLAKLEEDLQIDSWCYGALRDLSSAPKGEFPVDNVAAAKVVAAICEVYFQSPPQMSDSLFIRAYEWQDACSLAGLPSPNRAIRDFILSRLHLSMRWFISPCPEEKHHGRYLVVKDRVPFIFGDVQTFVQEVSNVDSVAGKELAHFITSFENATSKQENCVAFEFEHLHVNHYSIPK